MLAIDVDRIRAEVGAALVSGYRWWIGELRSMVPPRMLAIEPRPASRAVITIGDDDLVVSNKTNQSCAKVARIRLGSREGWAEARASIAPATSQKERGIIIRIPEARVLRKRIPLPLAARNSLREVLTHDLDRQLPVSAHELYFDYWTAGPDKARGAINIDLIAVKRSLVDEVLEFVAASDLSVSGVEIMTAAGPRPLPNLLPLTAADRRRVWERRCVPALCGLAALLAAGVVWGVLDHKQSVVDALSAELTTVRTQAKVAQQLQTRVEAALGHERFLPDQKRKVSVLATLDEVTRILPDDAWIFSFDMRGQEVRVRGFAPAASELLGRIAQSPRVQNARFRSPLIEGTKHGIERFDISVDLRGGP
jgi:general secretion pathway protein L